MNSDTRTPGSFHPWEYVQKWAQEIAVSEDSGLGHLRVRFRDATTFSIGSLGQRWSLTVYGRGRAPLVYEAGSIYECIAMAILGGDTLRPMPRLAERKAVHIPPPEATRELEELRVELAQVRLLLKQSEAEREKEAAQRDLAVAEGLKMRSEWWSAVAERDKAIAERDRVAKKCRELVLELEGQRGRRVAETREADAKLARLRHLQRWSFEYIWRTNENDVFCREASFNRNPKGTLVRWQDVEAILDGKDGEV